MSVPTALATLHSAHTLANHLRSAVAVQVVILDLKVFAQRNKNVKRMLVCVLVRETAHAHRESHWQVKRVEGRLVDDNEMMLLE